jgi:hypothetical protein
MATGGIVDHDETSDRYYLPPEHAAMSTTPTGLGPIAATNAALAKHVPQIVHSFREGGGVPYAAFAPGFTDAWKAVGPGVFDTMLLDGYLPLAPGLADTPRPRRRRSRIQATCTRQPCRASRSPRPRREPSSYPLRRVITPPGSGP